jgi:hypothetical protein
LVSKVDELKSCNGDKTTIEKNIFK